MLYELLTRSGDVLGEYGWHQGRFAMDDEGNTVSARDPRAASFCLMGAIQRARYDLDASNDVFEEGVRAVQDRIVEQCAAVVSVTGWNDYLCNNLDQAQHMLYDTAALYKPAALKVAEKIKPLVVA